jgi:hypothetical protein
MMVNRKAHAAARLQLLASHRRLVPDITRRWIMSFVPVMWIIWAAMAILLAALYVYRTSLTRDEEDQIFLDDSFEHEKVTQEGISTKLARVEPWLRITRWLLILMSIVVIAYYIRDILLQFHHA